MKTLATLRTRQSYATKQRGIVLFFALIAMLAMSLAAVALIRSVDTSTMIAGNLALKQSATSSGNVGIEAANTFLNQMGLANVGQVVSIDAAHAFNQDNPAAGYYASVDPALDLFTMNWDNLTSGVVDPDGVGNPRPDSSGNTTRYVIHRLCRASGVPTNATDCLYAAPPGGGGESGIFGSTDYCPSCKTSKSTPLLRITTRTTGPRGSISYLQAFVY